MQRLARLTLIFAILFAVFIIAPAISSDRFAPYPLMKSGDVLDLLTPLVLIPLYWLLFQIHPHRPPSQKQMLIFLIFAVLWVQGQGMHLVANSIGHLVSDDSGILLCILFNRLPVLLGLGSILGRTARV